MQEILVKTLRSSPSRKRQLLQKVEANLQGQTELCGSRWRRRVWGDRRRTCGGGWTPGVRFPIRPLWAEQGRHQSTCQETNTPPVKTGKRHTQSDTKGAKICLIYLQIERYRERERERERHWMDIRYLIPTTSLVFMTHSKDVSIKFS